jgi:hypothetical protein
MRLAGQAKQGFYPAPPEAIAGILQHLERPRQGPASEKAVHLTILDPCAGEGHALVQIAQALGIPSECTHAIELNAGRSGRIAEVYPNIRLLGPCSFLASAASPGAFSCIYLNPPFDDELGGGGREEVAFLSKALYSLAPRGVLVLVCPYNQVWGQRTMCEILDRWLEGIEAYLFPDEHRHYRECVVFGRRRRQALDPDLVGKAGDLHRRHVHWGYLSEYGFGHETIDLIARLGQPQFDTWNDQGLPVELSRRDGLDRWEIPWSTGPWRFEKTALTDEELADRLQESPLYQRLQAKAFRPLKRPPLSLNKGHTSLLLLTGLLDGYVPSDPPHIVRGYCGKREFLARIENRETEAGAQIEKKVYAQIPVPTVRAVWPDGKIRTFSEVTFENDFEFAETDEPPEPMEDTMP